MPKLKPDIDFIPGPNDKEQAEVFDCLQLEGEGYEDLDDDFIATLTGGQKVISIKTEEQIKEEILMQ